MNSGEKKVAGTLILLILMCFSIVTLGGFVRLSGSGLAIPKWPFFEVGTKVLADGKTKPILSVLPPMNDVGWEAARQAYLRDIPNATNLSLGEFKRIFSIEWSHRCVASLVGMVYLALLFFTFRSPDAKKKVGKLVLIGLPVLLLQASLGGIVVLFHLDAEKVALHLLTAFLFTSLLAWALMKLVHPEVPKEQRGKNGILRIAQAAYFFVACQIFSGGLMAGSKAGYMWNTWPMMGDSFAPPKNALFKTGYNIFQNFFENQVMIQFFHRWFAFFAGLAVLFLVLRCLTVRLSRPGRWAIRLVFGVVVLQIVLGILTLTSGVHPHLALTHQAVGLVLLLTILVVVYETAKHPVIGEEALAQEAEQRAPSAAKESLHA